jgi:hypothetical protein
MGEDLLPGWILAAPREDAAAAQSGTASPCHDSEPPVGERSSLIDDVPPATITPLVVPEIVTIPDEIDIRNADRAGRELRAAFRPGVTVVIADMTRTGFAASSADHRPRPAAPDLPEPGRRSEQSDTIRTVIPASQIRRPPAPSPTGSPGTSGRSRSERHDADRRRDLAASLLTASMCRGSASTTRAAARTRSSSSRPAWRRARAIRSSSRPAASRPSRSATTRSVRHPAALPSTPSRSISSSSRLLSGDRVRTWPLGFSRSRIRWRAHPDCRG